MRFLIMMETFLVNCNTKRVRRESIDSHSDLFQASIAGNIVVSKVVESIAGKIVVRTVAESTGLVSSGKVSLKWCRSRGRKVGCTVPKVCCRSRWGFRILGKVKG